MALDRKRNEHGWERPFYSPFSWPRWARITFIVTLPVSFPLWCVAVCLGWVATAAFFIVVGPFIALYFVGSKMFEPDRVVASSYKD